MGFVQNLQWQNNEHNPRTSAPAPIIKEPRRQATMVDVRHKTNAVTAPRELSQLDAGSRAANLALDVFLAFQRSKQAVVVRPNSAADLSRPTLRLLRRELPSFRVTGGALQLAQQARLGSDSPLDKAGEVVRGGSK